MNTNTNTNMKLNGRWLLAVLSLHAMLRRRIGLLCIVVLALAASPPSISQASSQARPFAASLDAPANPDACVPISFGQSIGETIAFQGEVDCFTFDGVSGDRIRARVVKTSGNLGPFLEITRPNGTTLCGTVVGELTCTLDANGTHTVLIKDFSGPNTGSYRLYVQRLNNPFGCTTLPFDSAPISGAIDLPAEVDCFTFNAKSGSRVRARVVKTSGTLGPFLEIIRPNGDHLCGTVVGELTCELDADGAHTVLVKDFSGPNTGGYQLSLLCLSTTCDIPPTLLPVISEVRPNQGRADLPNDINIYGSNFAVGATVRLGATLLATTYISSTHLRATVPAGLTPGVYDVTVTNPDNRQGTLANAYTVLDVTAASDDLFGYGYELWISPAAPFANGPAQVGLVVHREGGKQPLSNVAVRFYLGPCNGGTLLGDGVIPLLSPRSFDSTSGIAWTPIVTGNHTLCASIDPDNLISESVESNNVVTRTVTVLAQPPDQLAPHVDSFAINDGAATTSSRDVTLDTTASDPAPSSGLASLLFVEWEFSQAANLWVPARSSGWLPYATANLNFPWSLLPSPGMKYLQAWAADNAGNISLFPFKAFVNYVSSGDSVAQGQTRVHRYTLNAGQRLTALIVPSSGDADLYVWAPDHATRPPWVSNLSSGTDEVGFIAPVSGVYQVEVYGYTAASYSLTVDVASISAATMEAAQPTASGQAGGVDPNKSQPGQPVVPVASAPGAQLALPASLPLPPRHRSYLPVVVRQPTQAQAGAGDAPCQSVCHCWPICVCIQICA